MTTCVAIEHTGGVLLAADTQVSDSDGHKDSGYNKLLEIGECALAFCGDCSVLAALRNKLKLRAPKEGFDAEYYVYNHVLEQMRSAIPESLHEKDFNVLLVSGGRIVIIDNLYECVASPRGFTAIGSGARPAIASMMRAGINKTTKLETLRDEAKIAIQIASSLDVYTNTQVVYHEWSY